MKVKNLTAELISEVADEAGFVVHKYECSSPSNGSIIFEIEIGEEEEVITKKYKQIKYDGHKLELQDPPEDFKNFYETTLYYPRIIDLHQPDSLDELKEWFEDLKEAWDYPPTTFNGFTFTQPAPYKLTGPIWGTYPTTYPNATWAGGNISVTTTITTDSLSTPLPDPNAQINNHTNIFSFNPNFGSISVDRV